MDPKERSEWTCEQVEERLGIETAERVHAERERDALRAALAAARGNEARLRKALELAARSLHTASLWGTLGGYRGNLVELRAWAKGRESVALATLAPVTK